MDVNGLTVKEENQRIKLGRTDKPSSIEHLQLQMHRRIKQAPVFERVQVGTLQGTFMSFMSALWFKTAEVWDREREGGEGRRMEEEEKKKKGKG